MIAMLSYIKNDLIATKIGLAMMWRDKKYFLFALLLTIHVTIVIGVTILLMAILTPIFRPWVASLGNKSELLKAILWLSKYLLLSPTIIATVIALEFVPVAIVYYTFQRFSGKPVGIRQTVAHTFFKIKQHGPFAPFHQHTPLYFFAPLMAFEEIDWNVPATKMYQLWDKTIFAKNDFFWWSRLLTTLLIGFMMFKILTSSIAQANHLRQFGVDVVSLVFLVVTTLEIFLAYSIWTARIIFKTALYASSQGQPTGPFPTSLMKEFFIQK
jgi:hypothetical protein